MDTRFKSYSDKYITTFSLEVAADKTEGARLLRNRRIRLGKHETAKRASEKV